MAVLELEAEELEELADDPEELELELELEVEELEADELELDEELGVLMVGAAGFRGVPPQPNRDTQRHNKTAYFITALRREKLTHCRRFHPW